MQKSPNAFRTISEAAKELGVEQHVLRFWETKFKQIKPMKRGGGRRFYRPQDVNLIKGIKFFLYGKGYTIKGVQKILASEGVVYTANIWREADAIPSISIPDGLVDNNPTPSDFVSDDNPIHYSASVDQDDIDQGAHRDKKIKSILAELEEIKQIIKSVQ